MIKPIKLFFFIIALSTHQAHAVLLDLNLGLLTGNLSHNTEQSTSRAVNSAGLFAHLGKSDNNSGFLLGWYFSKLNNSDSFAGLVDQKVSSTDMGPAFRWQMQKELIYSVTYAYGIICKGQFNDGVVDEEMNGESHLLKLAVESSLSEKFLLGLGLNYYSAQYKKSLINSLQSDVSYKNTWFYPSLSLSMRY